MQMSASSKQAPRKKPPLVVHPLPAAPAFKGRERELRAIRDFWDAGPGVLSLIGLGGAGKTALAERFVASLAQSDPPDGMLVWSFYDDPDAGHFLKTAHRYFTGDGQGPAEGAAWFHLLSEALTSGGSYLLVLDGLERVQRPQTDAVGIYGELEDPMLRGLISRLATGTGNTRAILTSRFPVASAERWLGQGYTVVDVDQLAPEAARDLLRSHGVRGDDAQLDRVIADYGGHALTLDLLAGALARFFGGDPALAPPSGIQPGSEGAESARLAKVLGLFEQNLPPLELDLLTRLCVFRFGAELDVLNSIFLGEDKSAVAGSLARATRAQLEAALDDLVRRHLVSRDPKGRFTIHPAIRDHFYRLFRNPAELHRAVREHLIPLSKRPGVGLPSDKESLDLLEELVYHAIQAGTVREAAEIYMSRMGGGAHLNSTLGEYARAHRILSAFTECPDATGMYHCLRAMGRLGQALAWRPNNRYLLLLSGNLAELSADPAEMTRSMARALRGESVKVPDRTPDSPVPAAMIALYLGELSEAQRLAELEIARTSYADDRSRNELVLADVQCRRGLLPQAKATLDRASHWALNSGSQEHLCLMHLVRGRLALAEGALDAAAGALDEGIAIAREHEFTLWLIELLIERARVEPQRGRPEGGEPLALEALELARDPSCRFAWGETTAERTLGEIRRAVARA